jgi:membrane-bound lytic murein transglycosylase D
MAAATPEILLPRDNAIGFLTQLRLHKGPTASWTAWVVPKTMSVSQAAQQVGMQESDLRQLNKIPPRMMVRAGSSLFVERGKGLDKDVPEHVVDSAQLSFQPEVVLRRVTVKARKGETIAKLAKRYGVSASQVANWNALSSQARLKTGQQLTLMLPRKAATEQASSKSKTQLAKKSSKKVQAKAPTRKAAKTRTAAPKKARPVKIASAKPKAKAKKQSK